MPWQYGGKVYGGVVSPWTLSNYVVNCFCIFDAPDDNGELYIGDNTGNIYQLDTGYCDTSSIVTKDYDSGDASQEVMVDWIILEAMSKDASAGYLSLQFRVDQVLNTSITLLFPATGDLPNVFTNYFVPLQGIYDRVQGSKIGLYIWPSASEKHFAIKRIKLHGQLVPIPQRLEKT